MAGCCSGARSVVIEVTVLRVEGETCERCGGTVDAVRQAARELEGELAPMNVPVTLIEHDGREDDIAGSNTVLLNGRPLEEWIGAERVETDCPSCADLLGSDSVCCGAVSVGGETQESFTAEQVRDAAFMALGMGGGGGGGCGCS